MADGLSPDAVVVNADNAGNTRTGGEQASAEVDSNNVPSVDITDQRVTYSSSGMSTATGGQNVSICTLLTVKIFCCNKYNWLYVMLLIVL